MSPATAAEAEKLAPLVVTASAYKAPMSPLERFLFNLQLTLNGNFGWPAMSGDWVLTPERVPQLARNAVFAVDVCEEEKLRAGPASGLADPRLTSSTFGDGRNPGSLAMRVLLDGVPVDDAFDGSARGSELPFAGLARVEIVPGGGATAWGEAPSGVIQLFTLPATGKLVTEPSPPSKDHPDDPLPPRNVVHGTGVLAADVGDFGAREVEFVHTEPTRAGMIQVLGRVATTDGTPTTAPEWRGPLDTGRWEHRRWLEVRWRRPLGKNLEVTTTLKGSETASGLGTPYQQEGSRAQFAAVALAGHTANGFAWNGVAYAESRASHRTFGAVNPGRTGETPAIDEFAEPATSWGASWTGAWHYWGDARTDFGADLRAVRGETRSHFGFSKGVFAQEIVAGGGQTIAGLFVLHQQPLTSRLRATFGLRLDDGSETNGHSREIDRASGVVVRSVPPAGVSGTELSPTAGMVWAPSRGWRVRAAAQESFRRPTLAERYRWWGVRNAVIAPKADLKTERSGNAELTVEYSPTKFFSAAVRGFATDLRDAPGTRAIAAGAGDRAVLNLLPAGLEERERINLDWVSVRGAELSGRWQRSAQLSFDASIRWQDATIREAAALPQAVGNLLPRTPRRTVAMAATWQASPKLTLRAQVHWLGAEFVDEENTLRIGGALVTDCAANYRLSARTELFLKAANIGNARVESGRGADGVVYVGKPRQIFGGVRVVW